MLYLISALVILVLIVAIPAFIGDKRFKKRVAEGTAKPDETSPLEVTKDVPQECCGQHATCERDSLLAAVSNEIIYYDDEELDQYKGREAENYTDEEAEEFANVFYELKEIEVAGWVRSLQLRQIALPLQLMDEVLLVVRERRFQSVSADGVDHSNEKVKKG